MNAVSKKVCETGKGPSDGLSVDFTQDNGAGGGTVVAPVQGISIDGKYVTGDDLKALVVRIAESVAKNVAMNEVELIKGEVKKLDRGLRSATSRLDVNCIY